MPEVHAGAVMLLRLGVVAGRDDRMGASVRYGITATASARGPVDSDEADRRGYVKRPEQAELRGSVAYVAGGEFR